MSKDNRDIQAEKWWLEAVQCGWMLKFKDGSLKFGFPSEKQELEDLASKHNAAIDRAVAVAQEKAATTQAGPFHNLDISAATRELLWRFAHALGEKLAAANKKYSYDDGWRRDDWIDDCRQRLIEHIEKGDPRDVAAFCAFLWHHGERTELIDPITEKPFREILAAAQADTKRLVKAAQKVKPIVGSAVASASNEIRPLREKAYNEFCEAIDATMNQQPK